MGIDGLHEQFGFKEPTIVNGQLANNPIYLKWLPAIRILQTIWGHAANENLSLSKAGELSAAVMEQFVTGNEFFKDEPYISGPFVYPDSGNKPWDDVYSAGCEIVGYDDRNVAIIEQVEDTQPVPDFWSVFVHLVGGGVECIADFPRKEEADKLVTLIENLINSHLLSASKSAQPNAIKKAQA